MENDLISRSALLDFAHNHIGGTVDCNDIARFPAVDAVEVVRCRDCKHRGIVTECPMCYTEDSYDDDYGYDYWDVDRTVDDSFCHCGEMDAEVKHETFNPEPT